MPDEKGNETEGQRKALTPEQVNALPLDVRGYIHDLETNCDPAGMVQDNACLQDEVTALSNWVSDLQSGMYINCVYCGHRYGPSPGTPVCMADILKEHIAKCPKHPLSIMVNRSAYLVKLIHRMQRGIKHLYLTEDSTTWKEIIQLDAPWKDDVNRASGQAPCDVCRRPLNDHYMPVPEACPSVVEDCNGRWWKL